MMTWRYFRACVLCLLLVVETPLLAQGVDADFDSDEGFRIRSASEKFELRIGGRLHMDSGQFDSDVTLLEDNTDVRRARIRLNLDFGDNWRFRADRDIGGTIEGWKSLYVQYRGLRRARLKFGNQLVPFSLDELTGSNDTMFMERALPNALSPGILTGLTYNRWRNGRTFAAGVFGNELSDQQNRQSDGTGLALRATVAPIRKEGRTVHFGAAVELRQSDVLRYRQRPESLLTPIRLADTGTITGVDDTMTVGLESAAVLGRFQIQGEYLLADVSRKSQPSLTFGGSYIEASYVVGGAPRSYRRSSATFGSVESDRRGGAWEIAARFSSIDLGDLDIAGGVERNITLGLNWYSRSNFRVMLNRIWVDAAPNSNGIDESPRVLQVRFQAAL